MQELCCSIETLEFRHALDLGRPREVYFRHSW